MLRRLTIVYLFGGKGQTTKLIKPKQLQIISAVQSSLKMQLKCSVQLVVVAVNSILGWFLEINMLYSTLNATCTSETLVKRKY